jgi:hypothetical protein
VEIRRSLAVGGWDFAQPNHAGGDSYVIIALGICREIAKQ